MKIFRQNNSFISWLAMIAIVFSSLAPTISHAMAAANNQSTLLMRICSDSDIKYAPLSLLVKVDKNNKQDGNSKPMAMKHCAYCITHANSYAILTNSDLTIHNIVLKYKLPNLFYQSHSPLFVWASSNPRGPPFSS